LRISWQAFPSNERRDARGVWTSYLSCRASMSRLSLPGGRADVNQAEPAPDRTRARHRPEWMNGTSEPSGEDHANPAAALAG
jgi:hypothetical protein